MNPRLSGMLALCAVATGAALMAQAAELASVRRSDLPNTGGSIGVRPGGTFVARNFVTRNLIASAYDLPSNRILGTPLWAEQARYVIEARAEGLETLPQARPLLLKLLQDRFRMVARRETRDLPVYLLQLARADGALGPRIRKNDLDCENREARARATAAAAPGRPVCAMTFGPGKLSAGVISINDLIPILTGASGRTVLNRTGVDGRFDVELKWAPTPDVPDAVSIFTAVQEQLGLKLESSTAPLDVVVVDRLERPTEN